MKERLIKILKSIPYNHERVNYDNPLIADYLIANGVRFEKKVYLIEPIEDCERCPKVLPNADYCKEINLLYEGKTPKIFKRPRLGIYV